MLLAKIKEALSCLYEDIQETQETPAADDAAAVDTAAVEAEATVVEAAAEEDTAAADAAEEAQAKETAPEQEDAKPEGAEEPEEPTLPPGPRETDYKAKGYHLDVDLPPEKIPEAAEILLRENFFIESITGVDWIDDEQLEAVYDFSHFDELCRVVIRTRTDRNNPEIPTISNIYQGANWHERETHDFFGIKFIGHPNLEPLLLPEDADFHPLLKDFKA
ncbi:NADH-quinone oxidoreductase subunit C [Thermodesulfobacteriota bacterium]